MANPRSGSFGGRRQGTALGITSASSGEGKSTHALALARTAALAGDDVVLVDADLRRAGCSRLLDRDFRFTLRDFLQERCTANDVIALEECSGVHFVSSTPVNVSWTTRELNRFVNFVEYLKDRFAIVLIDLPPILGLAETIRLATAADGVVLVVRWGRTERQFVQFALDAVRSANVSPVAVILNDVDVRAQRRRGYRDHSVVYTDKGLYRVADGYQEPATPKPPSSSIVAVASDPSSGTNTSERQQRDAYHDGPRPAGSDIERLYNRHHD